MLPLAYQLNDSHLLNVSHEYISAILDRQEPDGWAVRAPFGACFDAFGTFSPRFLPSGLVDATTG